jgi:hypothetical protein
MIKKWSYIFGSKTKAQEMVFLLHDLKKVVRQGFYEHEMPKIERFCNENKINFVKSNFKVLLADETAYSNKGFRIPLSDKRDGMYFVYFSKDEQQAWMASYRELMNDNAGLGQVLGYPKCCVDFFCKRFSENNPNLQLTPTNIWTNLTKREQDHVLISHFPCSSTCEETIHQAQKCMDVLMKFDRPRAEELLNELKV